MAKSLWEGGRFFGGIVEDDNPALRFWERGNITMETGGKLLLWDEGIEV